MNASSKLKSGFALVLLLVLVLKSPPLRAAELSEAQKRDLQNRAPAATPALAPAEAQKAFTVPPGFEVRLFAAEPDVINPVAMTWDDRGRLWVVELYEYPLGAPKGTKPRDRIIILEDTDGDGRADKRTVFADGLNLATGILYGDGGVYVGAAPELFFLKDTNGDDVADERKVLLTGFGLEDRHELLNGFTWGPDGYLYLTHGVFTHSKVKVPEATEPGVTVNAAVARFHPRTKKFEVFADGTSNPWGVDFDRTGNAFISACVVDHFWHIAPGGIYVRQGGVPAHPYAYELLPSIVDHKHFRAAYAGVNIYQGSQFPAEWRGLAFMGNIHQSALNCDRLTPNGSSFKATAEKDFLTTTDGWFRPISEQVGPDGALWIGDWYDKYPCYQNARADPEGVDRAHGRIWRVVWTGQEPGKKVPSRPDVKMDLAKLRTLALIKLLGDPNIWQRRMAQRILVERGMVKPPPDAFDDLPHGWFREVFWKERTLETRLAALWTMHCLGNLDYVVSLDALASDEEPAIRAWAARFVGELVSEAGRAHDQAFGILIKLASDPDPTVRLAVATACRQFVSGSLTVNTPSPLDDETQRKITTVLDKLARSSADNKDPLIPFLLWTAAEPLIAAEPKEMLNWLRENGAATMPLAGKLAYKTMRRICDLQKPEHMDAVLDFLSTQSADAPLVASAFNGLVDGQKGKAIAPTKPTEEFFKKFIASPRKDIADFAKQLGAAWGNVGAQQSMLARISDTKAPLAERLKAIESARQMKNPAAAREPLLAAFSKGQPDALVTEAVRAVGSLFKDNEAALAIVGAWKDFTPATRRAAADVLTSRDNWASQMLSAIEGGRVAASDVSASAIRTITRSTADYGMLARRAGLIFGKVRDADADKAKLIAAKRKMILGNKSQPDLNKGREVAQRTCFTCHKLHGEGADIGPDLTGVGRSTLDALLANVIDPNQIIGRGYELVEAELKDGRTVSGRLAEENESRIRLLSAGPKEDVLARSDIASLRVSQLSLMPEGLEQMPDEDFRNLIAYILNPPHDGTSFSWKLEETGTPKPVVKGKPSKQ
ncbi:MAG: c-type cytochrome [Verrucomicrobia bacterium]|nr:c-type cytochrome [Verrucomicrobiota bacterium]